MFEINEESPYIHYLNDYTSTVPANGLCLLPKTMCNVKECEIATFLKLCGSGDYVEQLYFKVPRTRVKFINIIQYFIYLDGIFSR